MRYIQYLLALAALIQVLEACFITDCPVGLGKRSSGPNLPYGPELKHPECPVCGPSQSKVGPDTFRCYGPELCCSQSRGCLPKNSPGLRNCAFEDMNITPCMNHVKNCQSVGKGGQCVYKGVCCNPKGQCSRDETCEGSSNGRFEKILQDLEITIEDLMDRNENTDSEY